MILSTRRLQYYILVWYIIVSVFRYFMVSVLPRHHLIISIMFTVSISIVISIIIVIVATVVIVMLLLLLLLLYELRCRPCSFSPSLSAPVARAEIASRHGAAPGSVDVDVDVYHMCVCIYIYVHTYIHTSLSLCIYIYIYIYIHIYISSFLVNRQTNTSRLKWTSPRFFSTCLAA